MASAAFSFPILKPEEIISCLTELQIAATAADLKKPTAATSKAIYEALIEHCTGVRREELAQPRFHALDALSNQALHEESVGVIAFLRALYVEWSQGVATALVSLLVCLTHQLPVCLCCVYTGPSS